MIINVKRNIDYKSVGDCEGGQSGSRMLRTALLLGGSGETGKQVVCFSLLCRIYSFSHREGKIEYEILLLAPQSGALRISAYDTVSG